MNIFTCLNVYNEEDLLEDCIKSVREVLPTSKIILLDGAYDSWIAHVKMAAALELEYGRKDYGQSMGRFLTPYSNDNTIEIAKKMGVEYIINPPKNNTNEPIRTGAGTWEPGEYMPWECEWKKRANFFNFGELGDWFFILDADERVRGKLTTYSEDHYAVMLKRDDEIAPYPVHRFFKKTANLKMEGAHMAVWHGDTLLRKDKAPILNGVWIEHVWNKRAKLDYARHAAKGAYYKSLVKEEEKFRREYDI